MAVTAYKVDGFEHGIYTTYTYDAAATGTPTAVTSNQRSGARAMNINPAATTEFVSYNTAFTIVTVAFCIRFTTLPTATGAVIARIRNTNGNLILDWLEPNDQLRIKAGTGTAVVGGPAMTTGVYYRVVMEYDTSTGTATARCVIDNGTEFSATGSQTTLANTDVSLGATSSSTFDAIYDDAFISVTDGDYEEIKNWKNWEVLSAIPSSDGTHAAFASGDFNGFTTPSFTSASTNVWDNIDHRPLQAADTANNVVAQTVNSSTLYAEVVFEDPANTYTNVGGVQTYAGYVMASATGSPNGEVRLLLSDNTEVLTTGSISMIDSTDSDPGIVVTGRKRAAIAPSGGWDVEEVDGLKARIGFNGINADMHFIDLMLEVLFFQTALPELTVARTRT